MASRALLAFSLLVAAPRLALAAAPPAPADDGVPPAPLPDFGDEAPAPRAKPSAAAPAPLPRLDAARAAAAREAALRRWRYLRGGSRDGSLPVYDPLLRRTWRVKLESLDEAPFGVAGGGLVSRGRFAASGGEKLVLDLPLRPVGKGWEAEEPRIWSVGDQLRYFYDLDGRLVPLAPRAERKSPPWLKLFPWLKKSERP